MNEQVFDKMLKIKTAGHQKDDQESWHYHRYEPTPYDALDELFKSYEVSEDDRIVDFGCGKGRLNFYLHHFFNAEVVGIEMNKHFYEMALDNRDRYVQKHGHGAGRIHFEQCFAEDYLIQPNDNRFYFFNPFSISIFTTVVNRILDSMEEVPRDVELILYYASEDYLYFLEDQTAFELRKEIVLPKLYDRNPSERFLVYGLNN